MDRRTFVALAAGALLGLSPALRAQSQVAVRRIGFLSGFPARRHRGFSKLSAPRAGKAGVDRRPNILLLEPRMTGGDNARLPSLASELVAEAPDLILVQTVPATRVLMQATKTIPIVMVGVANPVELGSSQASSTRGQHHRLRASSATNSPAS
jgi:putative ABC transport system substrate-binding protein